MPVVRHSDIAAESFKGGATYQTLVGDAQGTTPIRVGIQNSPPGYKPPLTLIPISRRSRYWKAMARLGCKVARSSCGWSRA
jgi:hypothetical protein